VVDRLVRYIRLQWFHSVLGLVDSLLDLVIDSRWTYFFMHRVQCLDISHFDSAFGLVGSLFDSAEGRLF